MTQETVQGIEPTRPEEISEAMTDAITDLVAAAIRLGQALHPTTAAGLANLVRITNTYYSNLIEGHNTRPREIERALAGEFDRETGLRHLQIEAAAHVRLQAEIDRMAAAGTLDEPATPEFLRWLHHEFYKNATEDMLRIRDGDRELVMVPGEWRSQPEHDVAVGRHLPPSSARVADFMAHFAERYRLAPLGTAGRLLAAAAAHHRFNYIHPFPDGNGRVSRLMSHAMVQVAGVGAHGLWSISRGLSRGLDSRAEYKRMMGLADMPRQGDLDGRDNLSLRALNDFILWFLKICVDQVQFMSRLFAVDDLTRRLQIYAERIGRFRPEATRLLEEALRRGELERGAVGRITGLPVRTARRVLNEVLATGLLASETPKGPVSLRFPADTLDVLFPRLFAEV